MHPPLEEGGGGTPLARGGDGQRRPVESFVGGIGISDGRYDDEGIPSSCSFHLEGKYFLGYFPRSTSRLSLPP